MAKRLDDGEQRVMRKKFWDLPFKVVAHRVDSETPYVILEAEEAGTITPIYLTDAQVDELIERLQRALSILPTSK